MKVVFLSPVGQVGGAERVLLTLLDAWRASGQRIEPGVLALSDGPLLTDLRNRKVRCSVEPMPDRLAKLGDSGGGLFATMASGLLAYPAFRSFAAKLRQRLKEFAPDIIHANGLKAHLLASMAAPTSCKVAWHLHDFVGSRRLAPFLLGRVAGHAAGAVAVSDAVAVDFLRAVPRVPVSVIPNAVDAARFCPGAGNGAWLDGLAGMAEAPAGTVRVGLVATYALWKGHDLFIRAAARARASGPVRFFIIGGPIYATGAQRSRDELMRLSRQCRVDVAFVPMLGEMPEVYKALDVVVHASTSPEPFGLVIAEAMACGRAVVAAAAGGARDLFQDGEDALGYPMGDEAALASALERLIEFRPLRENLGTAAALSARQRFDPARQARDMADWYKAIMESSGTVQDRAGLRRSRPGCIPG